MSKYFATIIEKEIVELTSVTGGYTNPKENQISLSKEEFDLLAVTRGDLFAIERVIKVIKIKIKEFNELSEK